MLLWSGLLDDLLPALLSHFSVEALQSFKNFRECWTTYRILTRALSKKAAKILNESISQTWTFPTELVFVSWGKGKRETRKNSRNISARKGSQCNLLENILKFNTTLKLSKKLKPSPVQSHPSKALGQSLHARDKSLLDNLFWTSLSLILVYVPFPLAAQLFKSPF